MVKPPVPCCPRPRCGSPPAQMPTERQPLDQAQREAGRQQDEPLLARTERRRPGRSGLVACTFAIPPRERRVDRVRHGRPSRLAERNIVDSFKYLHLDLTIGNGPPRSPDLWTGPVGRTLAKNRPGGPASSHFEPSECAGTDRSPDPLPCAGGSGGSCVRPIDRPGRGDDLARSGCSSSSASSSPSKDRSHPGSRSSPSHGPTPGQRVAGRGSCRRCHTRETQPFPSLRVRTSSCTSSGPDAWPRRRWPPASRASRGRLTPESPSMAVRWNAFQVAGLTRAWMRCIATSSSSRSKPPRAAVPGPTAPRPSRRAYRPQSGWPGCLRRAAMKSLQACWVTVLSQARKLRADRTGICGARRTA